MGIIFNAYKDGEKVISLTEYSIEQYSLIADTDINLAPRFNDLTRDIVLIGIINPDTIEEMPKQSVDENGGETTELREIDSVRLLANWAIIPEYCGCYYDADVKLTNARGDLVKEESYKNLFVCYYSESFSYDAGKGSFKVQLREREIKPVDDDAS